MKLIYSSVLRIAYILTLSLGLSSSALATTFTVTNLNDSGVGSLRQSIINANAGGAGPHTINFAVAGTILINSGLPAIANTGITINGGGTVTINAQGGDIDRRIFTINASNTTVKGFTLQNTGSYVFEVAAGLSNVTIQDITASHVSAVMDNVVIVNGASTNMTIKNVMVLSGMQGCAGNNVGRPLYFQNGTQTNLLIEDVTLSSPCEGIVFRDASVNNLDIINTTIYGAINHIVFDNTGGPVETANDVTIDGENTASLYSQRDGGGAAMIYSDFVNTTWQIKNIVIDNDVPNTGNDADYGIRFDNTTNGITIDNVTMDDAEIYGLWFNGAATNINILNSNFENFDGWVGTQMIRFESTVTTLNITNTDINLDQTATTDDGDYGILFAGGGQKTGININDLTVNEADGDGIYFDGPATNFTLTNSNFTLNYDGIEFYNAYNHSNLNITNSTFTGSTRTGIFINTGGATNSGTISGNTISGSGSNGIWLIFGDGVKPITISNNTISFNGGAGIYVNSGPDAINITQNSIFRNTGNGIELDGGGNLSYEGTNRPTVTGSNDLGGGMWQVTVSLPTICNAAGGCTVQVFANASSDDVEGHYFVQSFTGLAAGSQVLTVSACTAIPCTGFPYGFWTATLKVAATGSVSEFSNKQSMKTQGPGAVNAGVALWLDAQDALSGNLPGGTGWQDRSGNDRDFDLVFGTPNRGTSGLNYNHYVQFNGGSYLRSSKSPFVNGFTAGEAIVVTRAYYRHVNQGAPFDLGGGSNSHYTWGNQVLYNDFGTNPRFAWDPATNVVAENKGGAITSVSGTRLDARSWNIFQTYSAAGAWGTGFNGQFVATTNTNTPNFTLGGGNEHIGAVSGYIFYGDVAEVIMYSRTLTTVERQKVNSYLALKYGTTLDQIATNQDYYASDWNGTTGTRMWQNDNDGYEWNVFGIGRDDNSGLQQKQSESIEQNAILSVGIGSTIATTNEANTATIATNNSYLTFADDNQLQRFGPAVTATNSNFRMHRTWKVDKTANWTAGSTVTFKFGEDFAGNYLLISSNATFTGITSELLLDANGAVSFNSDLLAHGSYFSVGAKMQLPGCVSPPVVSYPNYQEYYNAVHYPFPGAGGIGYGYNTNPATQSNENNLAFSGYYARNFTNSFACDNCEFVYRAKLTVPSNGSYTFYITSDDNSDLRIDGQYVAGVVTCCYTHSGVISLTAGTHDIEVRQAEAGIADYVTVEYSGPSIARQVIPLSALVNYTAPGVQTWLKADAGVTVSGTVTRWNDVSGNNNDAYQTNTAYNPTYNSGNAINFNPAVSTTGGQGMIFKKTIPPTNNVHIFAVGTTNPAHGDWNTLLRGINNDHPIIILNGSEQLGWFDNNNVGYKGSGLNVSNTEPRLMTMSHNGAFNTAQPRVNGKNGTVLTNIDETGVDYYQHFMNLYWQAAGQSFGTVSEFVAVSGTLTATDIQKIESYLALKYGITIDQTVQTDYLSSNSTIMWDASDNGIYKNDIAGIGKDLCQGLHQKQSKSVNSDALITMAVGTTIATTNAANTASVTADNSFLTWANNDLATTYLTNITGNPTVNLRMARVWKVDKTNWTDGDITLNLTGGNTQNYLVISNTDPAFAAANINQVLQLNASGSVTFNSSLLPDGAFFTFGKRIGGPACVNAGIATWWRADNNAADSLWQDYSGNQKDATQATLANRPTLVSNGINFNPAYDFNGSSQWLSSSSLFTGTGAFNTQIYAVSYTNNTAQQQILFGEYMSNGGYLYVHTPWVDGRGHWYPPYGYGLSGPWTGAQGIADLWSFLRTPTQIDIYENKKQIATQNSTYVNIAGNNSPFFVGRRADGYFFNGRVAELIVYNNSVATTATQRQQIESYLALKYGITIDQTTATDYLASDGTTKMWDATINSAYKTDIAGIGKDLCTGLHQKQSKSVNAGNLITMATGSSVAASNQANTNSVTNDLSFLVWGHNNLSTAFGPTVSGLTATARMSRVWRVDKTNTGVPATSWADQNITICAGQSGDRYLLINTTNAAFGAGTTEHAMNFSTGCVTINSSLLPDGAYFTMGTRLAGPACVNAGIQAWLRADYGAAPDTWADFSGNRFTASQATVANQPIVNPSSVNFNPGLTFASNKWMENTTAPLLTRAAGATLISVQKRTAHVSWAAPLSYNRNGNAGRPVIENTDNATQFGANPPCVDASRVAITPDFTVPFLATNEFSAGGNLTVRGNGGQYTATGTINTGESGSVQGFYISEHCGGPGDQGWAGDIVEVISYNRVLTATEKQKVESYLALKYGVTLNSGNTDYVATNWNGTTGTKMWDKTVNAGFGSSIAGIGKDVCTDLHQKQSKSINTGEILTVAVGSAVASTNVLNTNSVTNDLSFLVWGNNNGLNEFTTQVTGTNMTAVLGRVWRVDKTNWADQNITVCFDNYNDDDYLVISNTSATFAAINQEKQLSALGCVTFNSSELPDGAYFSVGKKIQAPGCVTGGIVTWLDAQSVFSGNMIDGVGWPDQSGNDKYFNNVSGDPARTDAALNYNHVVNFDGNDHLSIPSISTAFTQGEVFSVLRTSSNAGHAYAFGGQSNNHYRVDDNYENFGTNDRIGWRNSNNIILDGHTGLVINPNIHDPENWNLYSVWSAPNDWAASYNGYVKAQTSTNTVDFSEDATNYIGRGEADFLTGDVAEVVLYRRKLNATERSKVMSYLALKYGMTLDSTVTNQDYIASDGSTIWDWSDNNNYQHDIAGIGREECQKLNQKQSKSINGDDPLAIAAGNFTTFPLSNEANTTTITNDKSFLVWSNNNGALNFTTPVPKVGINGTFHTVRKWKIDKNNFANQALTISVAQAGERYLVVDEDGSGGFENDGFTKEYAFNFTTGLLNLNSINLPDGAVITLATKIAGPACVNSGIVAWLRADYGVTNDGTGKASAWSDFSGNGKNFTQTTAGFRPIINAIDAYSNYNPTLYYNYTTNYLQAATNLWTAGQSGSGFAVAYHANVTGPWGHLIDQNDDPALLKWNGLPNMAVFDNGIVATQVTTPQIPTMQNNVAGVFGLDFGTTANSYRLHFNGLIGGVTSGAPGIVNNAMRIGMQVDNTDPWQGGIPEVIIYNRQLTAIELQRVNSYLSLKYGVTITANNDGDGTAFETISGSVTEGDYVASDGTTIHWDGSTNTGYNSNVAGIGLDICTELSQKQSKSVNTGEILTGALGSAVAVSNVANTTAFADIDLSFLVWGNNDGINDFNNTIPATSTTSMAYLGRVWRAQKTNFANQNITLCFSGYNTDEYLLISNGSATFATVNQELQLNANGCITFNSSLLPSGAYFTLGRNIVGPACVDGGIKLWLRADGTSVADSLWADYSGNSNDAFQNTAANRPILTDNIINFNPAMVFDGVNNDASGDWMDIPNFSDVKSSFWVVLNKASDNDFDHVLFSANASTGSQMHGGAGTLNFGGSGMNSDANNVWRKDGGTATQDTPYDDGPTGKPNLVSFVSTNRNVTADYISYQPGLPGRKWNGPIAEVVLYNKALSATERQQVESYLSLKYGITLNNGATDYLASDGSNIWDASDNTGYGNDIAGLGKDICTNLHQKQSKSVNTGALITMAVGPSVANSNAANPNTVTNDKSFLVWAHNALATTFTTNFTKTGFTNVNKRTPRIWKVDKTNWADQDITICVGQAGERYLLIDNGLDADFADDTETSVHALSFSTGCVTINSSLLPDGAHFALGTEITGPACVNTGIKTWYRADYGASVSNWSDYSGNSNNTVQATAANQPPLTANAINFNPAFDFTNDDFFRDADGIFGNLNYTSSNVFVVQITDAVQAQSTFFENTSLNYFNAHIPWVDGNFYWDPPVTTNRVLTAWGGMVGVPYVWSLTSNTAGSGITTGRYIYRNRTQIGGSATAPAAFNGTNSPFNIGRQEGNAWYANAKIAEVVVYGGQITEVERQRIESYLALKYGTTLDQTTNTDYVASNGTTKMWTNDNDSYESDIAGIGKDECTNLHQKQSASVNTGNIVTVALGSTVQTTNALNTNTVTNDFSFLTWAHNGGALDFSTTAPGTNATARLGRVWKVDKTNWADQNITICFGTTYANNYLITNDTDGTFPTVGLEYQLDANGCYTLNSSDLPNGAFFTVGKNIEGPACVNGGIKVWLRADDGAATGAAWNDYSNNGTNFAQANGSLQAVATTNSMNFNPGLTFTNDDIASSVNTTALNMVNSDFEIIAVGKSTASHTNVEFPFASGVAGYYEGHVNGGASIGWRFIPDGAATDIGTNGLYTNTIPHIFGGKVESNAGLPYVDGKLGTTPVANAQSTVVTTLKLGRRGDNSLPWTGDITEYIVYNRALTATERQRVQSYLALKYGITMDMSITNQDYVASDGTNMWDWSDNIGYRNDVAGIGKDDCTSLHQKQSKSVNASSLITIATGSAVATTNALNTNAVTNDKSFFVWGNNGLATTFSTSFTLTGGQSTARTPRIWKVDKTNWQDQNITICVGQTGERYLLIDDGGDADFANDTESTEYALNFTTGCVTLNSSALPDGAHFSLGTKISGPGCVNTGIQAWYRADYGATAAQWTDFSGNSRNATQGTVANQAVLTASATNFNPAMTFNGSKNYDFLTGLTSTDPSTFIFVSRTNTIDGNYQALAELGNDRPGLYWRNGRANNFTFDVTTTDMLHPTTFTATSPSLFTFTSNNANSQDFTIGANGLQAFFTGADGTYPLGTGVTGAKLGAINSGGGINFNGDISEVVVYNRVITAIERQQVESYLALKYGITLSTNNDGDGNLFEVLAGTNPANVTEGDYVASNGTTIYWDASANTGYNNNIAGIGLDTCTELRQKQSKSVNTGEILSGALGSAVQTSNATNTTAFADGDLSFLLWGHNNGLNDFTETVTATGTTSMAYLGRVWKADKTNLSDNQNITLCFSGYDQNSYLLISSSSTFATVNQEFQLGTNGCYTLNSSLIPDGAFFTLGKVLQGPACVDGGIKLWLRADIGLQLNSNNELTEWDDQSGNNQAETVIGTPVQVANGTNFNPAVTFAGAGTEYIDYTNFANSWTAGSGFIVVRTAADPHTVGTNTGLWTVGGDAADESNFPWTDGSIYEAFGSSAGRTVVNPAEPLNVFNIYRATVDPALTNEQEIFLNSKKLGDANITVSFSHPQNRLSIARNSTTTARTLAGDIAEAIMYSKTLTTFEKRKVESYLALKYGITLDQSTDTDYLASDGTTTMWDNDGDNFEHDIAGIGKDVCTNLHQKQSKSVNADDLVTFALGSAVATTNAANTNTVTNDKSFFSWANDNGSTATFGTSVTTSISNVDLRVARVWKVDKTANWTDQDVTLCFAGQNGERYLVIDDNSSTMASVNTTLPLNPLTGCITLNTSNFQDGYYFGLATKILAPGCADNVDVLTWLRGDYAATVSQWNDFSGQARHAQQVTPANQPSIIADSVMNFNPAMDFNGNNFLTFDILGQNLNINPTVTDRDPITVLAVYKADNTSRPVWGNDDGGADRELYTHQVDNGTGLTPFSGGNVTGQNKLVTTILDEGTTNGSFVYADGTLASTFTQSGSDGGLSYTMLGRSWTGQGINAMFDGRIGEFIAYRGALTAAQRQQAESYLALKYGITLNSGASDYLASDGITTMWDASDNAGYNFNIAGIGRDDCPVLEQKQSRSVNTTNSGNLLTVALGTTVQTTNAANTNSVFNDLSFLTWGDNNGALGFSNTVTGTTVTTRMTRTWKVDRTLNWNDVQDITLCFNGYDNKSYLLVSNASATFATINVEQPLTAGGCITLSISQLPDGAFFTLGQNLRGPACVNTDIAMWLRADNGASVSAWTDFSGNATNATQGTGTNQPTVNTSAVNFNPALVFDGTDDFMSLSPLANLPYGASNRTIVTVGYSSNTVGNRWMFSYGTATLSQGNFWGQSGTSGLYGGLSNDVTETNYWTNNVPILTTNTYNGTTATIYKNYDAPTTAPKTWNTVQNKGYIGRQVTDAEYWQGGIGEVIVYNRVLNATELQAVNSYLAIKYGITIDQTTATDYIASNGTEMWDKDANATYIHDITGIGRDGCTDLNQKQSRSVNTDDIVTIGLGTIAASNAANSNTFASDLSFLTWSNNNANSGVIQQIATELPTNIANRLNREWRVQEVGVIGNVQLQFNLTSISVSATHFSQFALLIDDDGNFSNGGTTQIDASSYASNIVTFNNVDFTNGQYFTLGTDANTDFGDLPAPYPTAQATRVGADANNDGVPDDATAVWAGATIDVETAALINADSSTNFSDENGLTLPGGPLDRGTAYNFSINIRGNSANNKYYGLWFDWNNDGDFTDPTDAFYTNAVAITGTNVTSVQNVLIPLTATANYALRLIVSAAPLNATDYGATIANGEVEDYRTPVLLTDIVLVNAKVFLQGAAVGATPGTMRNSLQTYATDNIGEPDILPTTDPYTGTATYSQINDIAGPVGTLVDWVEIQIRSVADPNTILERKSLLLQTDGDVVSTTGATPTFSLQSQPVYIVVRHRNHVAITSSSIATFSGTVSYDFTTAATQAFKFDPSDPEQLVLVNGKWCMWAGDAVHDGALDANDLATVNLGVVDATFSQYLAIDTYMDGFMDTNDFSVTSLNVNNSIFSSLVGAGYLYP